MSDEIEVESEAIETTVDAQLPGMPLPQYRDLHGRNIARLRERLLILGHNADAMTEEEVIQTVMTLPHTPAGDGKWHLDIPLDAMPADLRAEIESHLDSSIVDPEEIEQLMAENQEEPPAIIGEAEARKAIE